MSDRRGCGPGGWSVLSKARRFTAAATVTAAAEEVSMIKFRMPARPGVTRRRGNRRLGDHPRLAVALMPGGKTVFGGTPDGLAARGAGHGVGGAPLERGDSAVLPAARS
jgi:hypothetical protein